MFICTRVLTRVVFVFVNLVAKLHFFLHICKFFCVFLKKIVSLQSNLCIYVKKIIGNRMFMFYDVYVGAARNHHPSKW